jgi:hypothetical protein
MTGAGGKTRQELAEMVWPWQSQSQSQSRLLATATAAH